VKRNIPFTIAILTLLGLVIREPIGAATPISADAAIARAWTERAAQILSIRPPSPEALHEAHEALGIASDFSTPGSDAFYLESVILTEGYLPKEFTAEDSIIREAFQLAGYSLDTAGLGDAGSGMIDFHQKAAHWCSLALRLHEYNLILERFEEWPRGQRIEPELLYAASRSAVYLGLNEQAVAWATQGESLSGSGTDLSPLGGSFGPAIPAFRAVAVAAGGSEAIGTLDAAMRRWGTGVEDAIRPWVLSGAMNMNTLAEIAPILSPQMFSLVEALDPIESRRFEEARWMALFREHSGDLALFRRFRAVMPDKSIADEFLSDFTGVLSADADYDGFPEEQIRYVNGRPDTRMIDSDQDGRTEWDIAYGNEGPLRVVTNEGELAVNYSESSYPEILSMVRKDGATRIEVAFSPGRFFWAPFASMPPWDSPASPDWEEEEFWMGARILTVDAPVDDGQAWGVAVTVLADGYPLKTREIRYEGPRKNTALWVRDILYEDGLPVAGRRSWKKNDGDSWIWELYERFENGEVVGIAWDPGMSGRPTYLRDWALERYLETQVWDMDGDGWMDVRRFILPEGPVSERTLLVTEAVSEDLIPWQASDWAPWER
jgi:hypothetical protein